MHRVNMLYMFRVLGKHLGGICLTEVQKLQKLATADSVEPRRLQGIRSNTARGGQAYDFPIRLSDTACLPWSHRRFDRRGKA